MLGAARLERRGLVRASRSLRIGRHGRCASCPRLRCAQGISGRIRPRPPGRRPRATEIPGSGRFLRTRGATSGSEWNLSAQRPCFRATLRQSKIQSNPIGRTLYLSSLSTELSTEIVDKRFLVETPNSCAIRFNCQQGFVNEICWRSQADHEPTI